jgi:hypothetical protein
MYDIGWEVADRTRRLLDLAEDIRTERALRGGAVDEAMAASAVTAAVIVSAPERPAPAVLDCPPAEPAGRPHAA